MPGSTAHVRGAQKVKRSELEANKWKIDWNDLIAWVKLLGSARSSFSVWCPVISLILACLYWTEAVIPPRLLLNFLPPESTASSTSCFSPNLVIFSYFHYLFSFHSLSNILSDSSATNNTCSCIASEISPFQGYSPILPEQTPVAAKLWLFFFKKKKKQLLLNWIVSASPPSFSKHIANTTIGSDSTDSLVSLSSVSPPSPYPPNIPNKYPVHFAGVGWHPQLIKHLSVPPYQSSNSTRLQLSAVYC